MSEITAISAQTKNKERCNVYVDGEFFAGVSLETVLSLRLKIGATVSAEKLKEIIDLSERNDSVNKAAAYISKALKTKKEVYNYLVKKGFSEEACYYAIDKLKEYGYIDDLDYCKRYIQDAQKTQGKKLISYKLMMKGVKKQDIESAFEQKQTDNSNNVKLLAEKYLKNKDKTKENVAKAYRYLIGRGFSYDEVNIALSEYEED